MSSERHPQPDSPAPAPKIDDGGPAYPEHFYFDPGKGMYGQYVSASCVGFGGMSLRDYFAAKAIAALIPLEDAAMRDESPAGPRDRTGFDDQAWDGEDISFAERLAEDAYIIADAMLAARKGGVS